MLKNRESDPEVIIGYARYLFLNENSTNAINFLESKIIENKSSPKIYVYLGKIKGAVGLNNEKQRLFLKRQRFIKNLVMN